MDRWRYAVAYCEKHECTDCYVYKNNLDTRSLNEYRLHTPCCENIYTYMERNNLVELPEER